MALLAIIVVSHDREKTLAKRLVEEKFVFTRVGSTGGFLRKRSATLFVGLKDDRRLEALKKLTQSSGGERQSLVSAGVGELGTETGGVEVPLGAAQVTTGGTTLFVVKLEDLQRY